MTNNQANILVVDDTPDNLRLLSAMLTEQGYKVRKALNGQTALNTVQKLPPDLILLDINMPGMNGYQVCSSLKTDQCTQEIPVIFISALDDVLDKIKAFNVGGVDYITKPFQSEEVLARIENQLTICRQKKQLTEQNERLQQEIREREKAEEALRVYLHAVSHDLRNPVIAMSMVLKNLLKKEEQGKISIAASILKRIDSSCDRQLNLIDSLVETQQLDVWGVPLQCQPLELHSLTQQLAQEWEPMLLKNQGTLENRISPDSSKVSADANQLWRVFENLIANALKHNPPGVKLTLNAEMIEVEKQERQGENCRSKIHLGSSDDSLNLKSKVKMVCCTVADNGVGMNAEQSEGLFELYRRGNSARRTTGLGLGLYLCRQIITAHGGEIGAIANPDAGAKFWFTLPIAQ